MSEPSSTAGWSSLHRWWPWIGSILWFLGGEWLIRQPRTGSVVFLIVAVVIVLVSWRLWRHLSFRWTTLSGLGLLLAATAGAVAFATTWFPSQTPTGLAFSLPSQGAIVLMSILVGFWLDRLSTAHHPHLQGRRALFLMTCTVWSLVASVLSCVIFLNLNWWLVVPIISMLLLAAAFVIWSEVGMPWSAQRSYVWPTLILGSQLSVAAWMMPTTVVVSSTVVTTVTLLYFQVARHLWQGTWDGSKGRRYALVASLIIFLSMVTARWV